MSRKRTKRDGLELFLDAICNMFGGFIFIMLFVVVSIRMSTEEQRAELKASEIEPVQDVELETLRVEIDRLNKDIKNVVKQQEDSRKFVEDLVDPAAGDDLLIVLLNGHELLDDDIRNALLEVAVSAAFELCDCILYRASAEYGIDGEEVGYARLVLFVELDDAV